jgi:Xaa-Pro aminopeptidase
MKEEILGKVREGLESSDYDAILVFGVDNVQYISGAPLHFPYSFPDRYMAVFWARTQEPVCICPFEWEGSFLELSWIVKTEPYIEVPGDPNNVANIVARIAESMKRLTGKIGVDVERTPLKLYNTLKTVLNDFDIIPCDSWLRTMRMTKTPRELMLLRECAFRTDHAIAGQAHHILVLQASPEMSIAENVRVHAIERELDEVGHHSIAQVTSGENAKKFWFNPPMYGIGYDRIPQPNEFVRLELNATLDGYWSTGARMLSMGEMSNKQKEAYKGLVTLRKTALHNLKPGVKCNHVFNVVKKIANEKGVNLIEKLGIGHGIGVAVYEPPFLNGTDNTELKPGMMLVISPVVLGPDDELMMSKDTVEITQDGAEIIGWYQDWRIPYIANYTL